MIGEVVLPPERAVAYYGHDLCEAHLPHNFALTEVVAWTA
jgi:riboflavin biosynthesis pyrimidine reductase